MSYIFGYIDGEFRFIDDEMEVDESERLEESCESERCAVCNEKMDWSSECDKFVEAMYSEDYGEPGTPLPVNVCCKCALEALKNGELM